MIKMVKDKKKNHPFNIQCRYCGSNCVAVYAFEYNDMEIRCRSCGTSVSCGNYYTDEGDYSEMVTVGSRRIEYEDDD